MPRKRSLTIAHVTFSFWPIRGGAEAYLAELYRVFQSAGHEQTIYHAEYVYSNFPHPLPPLPQGERGP